MAVRKIILHPDKFLRKKSKPVDRIGTEYIDKVIKDLVDSLNNTKGIALSACQIGYLLRIPDPFVSEGKIYSAGTS